MATTIVYKHIYNVQNGFIVDKPPYVYAFMVIVGFDLSFISPITCSRLEMRKFAAGGYPYSSPFQNLVLSAIGPVC